MPRRRRKMTRRQRTGTFVTNLSGSKKVGRRGYEIKSGEDAGLVCRCPPGSDVVSTAPKGATRRAIIKRGGKGAARGPGRACMVESEKTTRVRGAKNGKCPKGWTKRRYKNKEGHFCLKKNVPGRRFVSPQCG